MEAAFADFSNNEKKTLRGQSNKLASKHGCSGKYVTYIINGERNINTPLAKKIYNDLNELLSFFNPVEES